MADIIVIGDSAQIAQFVEQNLQILQLLREQKTVNEQLTQAFAKLQADIDARNQADKAKDQQIADLTAQVNSLTAAEQATSQAVLDAVNQADASVNNPPQ